jgi:hypothetical protein
MYRDHPQTGIMNDLTLIIHVYYRESWAMILAKCGNLFNQAKNIIVTICDDDVRREIKADAVILKVTNKGKDVGGKLAGLSYYFNHCEPTRYLAFLHDKISPQTLNAGYWFDKLYEVFSPGNLKEISRMFNSRPDVGLVGSKTFLKNEYVISRKIFNTTNDKILRELLLKYALSPTRFNYIGGTIFITKDAPFRSFFANHPPLWAREDLEEGNVLDLESGTYTHSWERLFCFIPQAQGLKVVGV